MNITKGQVRELEDYVRSSHQRDRDGKNKMTRKVEAKFEYLRY